MGNLNKKEVIDHKVIDHEVIDPKKVMIDRILHDIRFIRSNSIIDKFSLSNKICDNSYQQEIFINPKEHVNYPADVLKQKCYVGNIYNEIVKNSLSEYFHMNDFTTDNSDEILYMTKFINNFWAHASHNFYTHIVTFPITYKIKFNDSDDELKDFTDKLQKIIDSVNFTGIKRINFGDMAYAVMMINNMKNIKKDIITKFYDEIIVNVIKNRMLKNRKYEDEYANIYSVICDDNTNIR